jgi:hypothetical protein
VKALGIIKGRSAYCKAYVVLALKQLKFSINDIERILVVLDSTYERYDNSRALSKAKKIMDEY